MTEWKVGLVGAGHIADTHLAAWRRQPRCRLHGVHDLDRGAARRRAGAYRIEHVFDELDALIDACDVVDVVTPPATHAGIAGRVINAGRHLLIEKPVVIDAADWPPLRVALERSRAKLAVVHNLKFARAVRRARAWLDAGRIGRLLRLDRVFFTDPASDRMLARPHWSHELPGGRWFETLPHALYLIHDFMGPLEAASTVAVRTPDVPRGVPADEVTVVLRGSRGLAHVHYSARCRLNHRHLSFWGTAGRIEIDLLADSARISTRRDSRWRRALGELPELASRAVGWPADRTAYALGRMSGRSPHHRLIAAFARHLDDEAPSPTPLEEVDYVVRTGSAIGVEIERQTELSPDGSR